MMHVVTALPPSNREATAKVGDEHTDQGISDKVMGDASMARVVCCEHYLMLQSLDNASIKYSSIH